MAKSTYSSSRSTKKTEYGAVSSALAAEFGKLPPHAADVEKSLLGALLIQQHAYDEVREILSVESFYEKKHQQIFAAMQRLSLSQRPIDSITVSNELKVMGELDFVGGVAYLAELIENTASSVHIREHADIIQNKFLARDLIRISSDITAKAFSEETVIKDLMADAEGQKIGYSGRSCYRRRYQKN